jgi:hypothetical protein
LGAIRQSAHRQTIRDAAEDHARILRPEFQQFGD